MTSLARLLSVIVFPPLLLLSAQAGFAEGPDFGEEDYWDEAAEAGELAGQSHPGEQEYWEALIAFFDTSASSLSHGREMLRRAADQEFSPAQNLMGLFHLFGAYGFEQSDRRAVNWFELAVERGDRHAMVNLAISILDNRSFWRRDTSRAQTLLETALAETESWYPGLEPPEAYRIAQRIFLLESDPKDREVYQRSMQERSEGIAAYQLGRLHLENKDFATAHPYFVQAATIGENGRGGVQLAAIQAALNLAFGHGVERDMKAANEMLLHSKTLLRESVLDSAVALIDFGSIDRLAMRHYREMADKSSEVANLGMQLAIARTFGDRKSKDFDVAQAVLWYELAAEQGHYWAIIETAQLYSDRSLPVYDLTKAFYWWEHGYNKETKHVVIISNYLICLYHGIGTEADPETARELFEKERDKDIVAYLGTRQQLPKDIVTFEERIDLMKDWAQKHRDAHAQYLYGLQFYYGWGVNQSLRSAYRWFTRAADQGHAEALYMVGQMYWYGLHVRQDREKANEYYRQSSTLGSSSGAFQYAYNLSNGIGLTADRNAGLTYYERTLELNPQHAMAHNNLGVFYEGKLREALRQPGGSPDNAQQEAWREKLLYHFGQASELNNRLATRNLALIYFNGGLVPQDYRRALMYANKAADQGEPRAYYLLGQIYDEGLGVGRNVDEAAYYFRLAGLNDPDRERRKEALAKLCNYYLTGASGNLDLRSAMGWMILLARNGAGRVLTLYGDALLQLEQYRDARRLFIEGTRTSDPYIRGHAYDRLSLIYANGLGVRVNMNRSERYIRRAIELEYPDSLYALALSHQASGNLVETVNTLRAARSKGSRDAAYLLGQFHLAGNQVEQNPAEAIVLFREAAAQNHRAALFDLAVMCFRQMEGAPDIQEAIEFARRAEALGHPQAKALREALEKRMQDERSRSAGSGRGGRIS